LAVLIFYFCFFSTTLEILRAGFIQRRITTKEDKIIQRNDIFVTALTQQM